MCASTLQLSTRTTHPHVVCGFVCRIFTYYFMYVQLQTPKTVSAPTRHSTLYTATPYRASYLVCVVSVICFASQVSSFVYAPVTTCTCGHLTMRRMRRHRRPRVHACRAGSPA